MVDQVQIEKMHWLHLFASVLENKPFKNLKAVLFHTKPEFRGQNKIILQRNV